MRRKIGEILVARGVVTAQDVDDALADQSAGDPSRLGDILIAAGKLTPRQLAQGLAEQAGVPYTELPQLTSAVLESVPLEFQRTHKLVPIRIEGDVLSIAMADLSATDAVSLLKATWSEVRVFATGADEVDALHGALVSDLVSKPAEGRPAPVASSGSSPSVDELFGSLNLDGDEPRPPPPNVPFTASGLFGDLDLESVRPLGSTPSGHVDLTSLDAAAGQAELAVLEGELVSAEAPAAALVFEAPPESLQPPVSAPPTPAPAPLVSGPSVLARLLDEAGGTPAAALTPTTKRSSVPPPRASPARPRGPGARPADAKPAGGLELPDWLRGDAPAEVPSAAAAGGERWTGELEVLAPSRLIAGIARALIRKGFLSERDVLEALEQPKA
jgi:hypothetical protein